MTASLAAQVIIAPHFIGGAFAWSSCMLAACSVVLLTWSVVLTRTSHRSDFDKDFSIFIGVALLAITTFHAIPLPLSWVTALSPRAAENALASARALGTLPPHWIPLSLEPGATYERVAYTIAVLATFCAVRLACALSRSTYFLIAVAASALIVAASHLMHRVLRIEQVYGIYQPTVPGARGPLINLNHLAGFMALGLALCIGLAISNRGVARAAWAIGAVVAAATGLLANSRGGAAVIFGIPVIFGLLTWLRSRVRRLERDVSYRSQGGRRRIVASVVGLLTLTPLLAYLLARLAAHDFVDTDLQDLTKLDLLHQELRALLADPHTAILGAGRGAFAASFSPYFTGAARAAHAECLPLQYATELGIPVTLCAAGFSVARISRSFFRWLSPAHLGALVGVSGLIIQNLVDFSLEMSGIAVPVAACFAAALPRLRVNSTRDWADLRKVGSAVALGSAVLLALVTPSALAADLHYGKQKLDSALSRRDSAAFWIQFDKLIWLHTGNANLAVLAGAQRVMEMQPLAARVWLNRAMWLAPGWGTPHLWAAHQLATMGRWDQSSIELRIAAEISPWDALRCACAWVSLAHPVASYVINALPEGNAQRIVLLNGSAACLYGTPSEARLLDKELLKIVPDHVEARVRETSRLLHERQFDSAIASARELRALQPRAPESYALEATALQQIGEPYDAIELLSSGLTKVDERRPLLIPLAQVQAEVHDLRSMRQTIDHLRTESGGNLEQQAQAVSLLGQCEATAGNNAAALKAFRESYSLKHDHTVLAAAAQLAETVGQRAFATDAWRQLCTAHPEHPAYCSHYGRYANPPGRSE